METLETDGATGAQGSCNAARILADVLDEQGPCEGPQDAVLILSSVEIPSDRLKDILGTRACVHHGAYLYVGMRFGRVYPNGEQYGGCAIEVYKRAQAIAQRRADLAAEDARRYLGGMAA